MWVYVSNDVLMHHGIKGQRWGVRRYQRRDGTLTTAGKKRYGVEGRSYDEYKADRKFAKRHGVDFDYVYDTNTRQMNITSYTNRRTGQKMSDNYATAVLTGKYKPSEPLSDNSTKSRTKSSSDSKRTTSVNKKKVAIGMAAVGGAVLVAYGATKYKKLYGVKAASDTANTIKKASSVVSKTPVEKVRVSRASVERTKINRTPIRSFGGHDTGFTQDDMQRMLDNLGKMSDIAKKGQDVLRNL